MRTRLPWAVLLVGSLLAGTVTCFSGCATAQGTAQGSEPEPVSKSIRFIGLRPIVPDAVVRGVWEEVGHCLQAGDDMEPEIIRWGVATGIVDLAQKQLLWGVVANVYWPEGVALTAVVDERVRYNVRVWSHEIVHVRANVYDGDWHLDACTLDVTAPYILPLRPLTDAQIAVLAPPSPGTP